MPGRTPLHRRVARPADRGEVVDPQLGLLVLQELQRQPLDREVVVAGQRGQGVGRGAEAVHEDQRQGGAVLPAQVQHLSGDHVEEGQPAAYAQQRLGAGHAHRGAEAAVELDHDGLADGRRRRSRRSTSTSASDVHVQRVDRALGDHPGLAVLDLAVVVREDVDRHWIDAGGLHLLARLPQSLRVHDFDRRLVLCRSSWGSPNWPCATRFWRPEGTSRWPSSASAPGLLADHLLEAPELRQAATVAAYVSVSSEPGTGPLLDAPARRRQAGDPAAAAARQRPRLGGVRRARRPAHRRAEGCSSRTARPWGSTPSRRPTRSWCPASPSAATGCAWAAAAGPTTGRWSAVPAGTFVCVLLNSEEVLDWCRATTMTGR